MFMRRVVTLLAAFVIAVSAAAIWSAQRDGRDGDPDTNVVNTSGAQAGGGIEHSQITEIYHVIEGNATLGAELAASGLLPVRRRQDSPDRQ